MKKDLDLGWFDLKKTLQNADRKELINIILDLYRLSEENRKYLLSGSTDAKTDPEVLEAYREVIKMSFFLKRGMGRSGTL